MFKIPESPFKSAEDVSSQLRAVSSKLKTYTEKRAEEYAMFCDALIALAEDISTLKTQTQKDAD